MPDGHEMTLDIVAHPGSVGIIACPEPNSVVLVRQYRHAAGAWLWEIPAGTLEPGESPTAAALRELAEETGYRARTARDVAAFFVTPGFCDERVHLVLAEDLAPGTQSLDPDEAIDVRVVAINEARAMAARDEIADAKTLIALSLLL